MRSLSDSWARFGADRKGGMAALAVAGALVAAASAAVSVDAGKIYAIHAELEITADAAALAAATHIKDLKKARKIAVEYAAKNMPVSKYGVTVKSENVEFGYWDADKRSFEVNDKDPFAVRVTATYDLAGSAGTGMIFAPIFGIDSFSVSADAVAGKSSGIPCILVLDDSRWQAFSITQSASVSAVDCGVQVNSTRPVALEMTHSAKLESQTNCISGGASLTHSAVAIPAPIEYCPQALDPLAHLQEPDYGACNHTKTMINRKTTTLLPGVYCGGLRITNGSTVTFSPGLYVIKDGEFRIDNRSQVIGRETTFFLDGSWVSLAFETGSNIDLTAPTSGEMTGILIFQARNAEGEHFWDSDSASNLVGTIYAPNGQIYSAGGALMTPIDSCTVIIAKYIAFARLSGISIDISKPSCKSLLPTPFRKSVALLD